MQYVYFTKSLKELDVKGVAAFCKEVGVDGVDLTVRKGYPVNPDNAATALPDAVKILKDAGLVLGLVSIDTDVNDADGKTAKCGVRRLRKSDAPAVKIGYFAYKPPFDDALKDARSRLKGFAKLAEQSKVPRLLSYPFRGDARQQLRRPADAAAGPRPAPRRRLRGHRPHGRQRRPDPHGAGHGAAVAVAAGHQGYALEQGRPCRAGTPTGNTMSCRPATASCAGTTWPRR